MKRLLLLIAIGFLIGATSIAQTSDSTQTNPYVKKQKSSFASKLYFGGNLTLTFGSYTSIGIWPLVGYKVTPKLSFGLQPGYEYLKYDNYYGGDYETSSYGIRIFGRYRVIPQAYVHAEYASINYEFQRPNIGGDYEDYREWVPFLFLGAGFSQRVGGGTYAYVQVLFDVLQNENSPYGSGEPFWTVGVAAGF
ncbi:MAG: hypothetical protein B6I19_02405 [Bacteroidetes bacterium 4572_114]|nr:MAG: hypothetical protein B6I19_02405 [Bacteroidetes bacterium 4572_114]